MGYNVAELRLSADISNHNSPQDAHDKLAWNELVEEIEALLHDPRFRRLHNLRLSDTADRFTAGQIRSYINEEGEGSR